MAETARIPEEPAQDRNFVTALSRGLSILEALGQSPQGMGMADLAQATQLPKPTIARLTHTLIQLGYLRADRASNSYVVTAKLMTLSANAAQAVDIAELAMPELMALRDGPNPGITASLTEVVGPRLLMRNVVQSKQQNALWMQAGIVADILETAAGRVILAASDRQSQAEMVAGIKGLGHQNVDAEFRDAVNEFAEKGFCTGFRKWRADVNAIAAPLRAPGGMKVYSISVGGPSVYVSEEQLEDDYGPLVKTAVRRLTGQIDV